MKIIEPTAKIIYPPTAGYLDSEPSGIDSLRHIEKMARISHRSEDKQTPDSWRRFIRAVVIEHGDWSVVEHASLTVIFRVDRGITHELVRHRLFSFTQESTRFVNGRKSYPDGLEFIRPVEINETYNPAVYAEWVGSCRSASQSYFMMLEQGCRPQEARSILPNSLASTIAVTGNLRNWRHFFLMRTSKETHPDFRRVTIPLLEDFKKEFPILFDDIESNARQIDNLRKPR